jgi:hypothetical protein
VREESVCLRAFRRIGTSLKKTRSAIPRLLMGMFARRFAVRADPRHQANDWTVLYD